MKTKESYRKHGQVGRAVAQRLISMVKRLKPQRILLIDGNAGDGHGVGVPGRLLTSETTAHILIRQAIHYRTLGYNVDVILCEKKRINRKSLEHYLRQWCPYLDDFVRIIGDHHHVIEHIHHSYDYVVWLSDPAGYSHHGEFSGNGEHPPRPHESPMFRLTHIVPHCDFFILFNETTLTSTKSEGKSHGKQRSLLALANYRKTRVRRIMLRKSYFADVLELPYLARQVNLQKQSPRFGYRIILVSTDPVGHYIRSWNVWDRDERLQHRYDGASREMERIDLDADDAETIVANDAKTDSTD